MTGYINATEAVKVPQSFNSINQCESNPGLDFDRGNAVAGDAVAWRAGVRLSAVRVLGDSQHLSINDNHVLSGTMRRHV